MKIKKLDKNQYEIINNHYIIYISKEKNPVEEEFKHLDLQLYFIDVFEHNKKDANDNEVFNELYLAVDYIKNNYEIPKTITKQIKL